MGEFKLVSIKPSTKSGKKLMATFENKNNKRRSVTHFGATGYSDYTVSKDKEQRARYRSRHKGDNLTNPRSPGALSWYILWGNSTSRSQNTSGFRSRFGV
jgi:hypothetical protein